MTQHNPPGAVRPPASGRPPSDVDAGGQDAATVDEREVHARLAAAEKDLAETRDRLLRVLADQDNVRKVAQRERDQAVRYAAARLAADLPDALDNLSRAIQSARGGGGVEQLLEGVIATERNLLAALAKHGIRKIEPLGERFDPMVHHAAYRRADPNADDGTVIEVLQPGYILHERVLRPAVVGVSSNDNIAPATD